MAERAQYTILSMMKDEGHSLIEWVAYHRVVGFDRICVYTNDCNDGTDAMLMRLADLGYVHHFRNDVPEGRKPQPNALSLADENDLARDSDWILVMDADEFLNVKVGDGRVSDLVASVPGDTDAVAITWRFFGSNGVTDWNPGLVTDTYTRAAPDDFKKGWGVKTLFRPYDHMKFGIHRPGMHGARKEPERARAMLAQKWVNGSGVDMPEDFSLSGWRSTKPTLGYDLVEMNHYAVKSYEAYLLRRMRGNVNNKADKYNAAYFSIFDRNEVEARGAERHAPAVKALMAEMLADAELARLYEAALAYHGARVDALRATGEYDAWLTELREASKVPLDKVDEVLFTQHLPKVWQDRIKAMQAQGVSDKAIAKMIADSQTAKKGETRAALRAAAEGHPEVEASVPLRREAGPRVHLVSTMKNEGPYILEWIAHHRRIGVTDFTLFSNDCTDGTNLILNRLDTMGIVRHFDNPIGPGMDPQRRAYSRAGRLDAVRQSDWVLIVDADEFLNVHAGDGTVGDLIDACDAPDAISVPWRLMGSSGAARMSEDPVTARFTHGSDFDTPENGMVWGFKTLFRPASFDYFGVHRPKFKKWREALPERRWTNASGTAMPEQILRKGWRFNAETLGYAHAQVNHYAIKSREEFLLKRLRGTANSKDKGRIDLPYWQTYDLNTHADASIGDDGRAEALQAELAGLLADPDLAALHRASLDVARRTIADQLEDPDLVAFVETGALPDTDADTEAAA